MATDQAQKLTHFILWAPDYADALERRLAVRPSHLERVHQLTQEGILRVGGGLLSADHQMCGSCLIIEAPSLEDARRVVEEDIYYKTGVWDREKLQILPIMLATPLPPPSA